MCKTRVFIVALFVLCVSSAVASASAYAGEVWLVKGKTLTSGEKGNATTKFGKLTIKWEDSSSKTYFEAECAKASGESELKGGNPGTDKTSALKIKECVLVKAGAGCELTVGGVTTEELPGWSTSLELKGGKVYDVFSGVSFSLILEGCEKVSFSKTWLFRGTLKAELTEESGKLKVVFPSTPPEGDSLKAEGAEAKLVGEGKMEEKEGGTLGIMEETVGGGSGPYMYNAGASEPFMGALELSAIQSGNSEWKVTIAGVAVKFQCEEGHSEETHGENVLSAGIEHFLGLTFLHFLKCTVTKPAGKGCLVTNELILVHSHILGLIVGGVPRVQFYPLSGNFTNINIDGCSNPTLNGTFPMAGSLQAIPNNTTSTLELTESSGSELEFAGNSATFTGNFAIEMKGGGALEFK
jgi:hypothetical protein